MLNRILVFSVLGLFCIVCWIVIIGYGLYGENVLNDPLWHLKHIFVMNRNVCITSWVFLFILSVYTTSRLTK